MAGGTTAPTRPRAVTRTVTLENNAVLPPAGDSSVQPRVERRSSTSLLPAPRRAEVPANVVGNGQGVGRSLRRGHMSAEGVSEPSRGASISTSSASVSGRSARLGAGQTCRPTVPLESKRLSANSTVPPVASKSTPSAPPPRAVTTILTVDSLKPKMRSTVPGEVVRVSLKVKNSSGSQVSQQAPAPAPAPLPDSSRVLRTTSTVVGKVTAVEPALAPVPAPAPVEIPWIYKEGDAVAALGTADRDLVTYRALKDSAIWDRLLWETTLVLLNEKTESERRALTVTGMDRLRTRAEQYLKSRSLVQFMVIRYGLGGGWGSSLGRKGDGWIKIVWQRL